MSICSLLLMSHILLLGWLCYTWLMLVYQPIMPKYCQQPPFVSVIIPVRNEASHITALLLSLNQQSYAFFEVIIINDASTDATVELIEAFRAKANFSLRLLHLPNTQANVSPKKRAITLAMPYTKGELIMTTDGDCVVPPHWISTVASFYRQTKANFISSPVAFHPSRGCINALLHIELASLIGVGACTLAKHPFLCNAANMAYPKAVFEAVDGYVGNEHIASGDDVFLLKKITEAFPQGLYFLADVQAQVYTQAPSSWMQFYQQRKRWASKWRFDSKAWLAPLFWVMQLFGLLAWFEGTSCLVQVLLVSKILLEAFFLAMILRFQQQKWCILYLPVAQMLYPFYALFFGLVAHRKGYDWKSRSFEV